MSARGWWLVAALVVAIAGATLAAHRYEVVECYSGVSCAVLDRWTGGVSLRLVQAP